MSTPEDQSSHLLPHLSYTLHPTARSMTSGGCPCMEEGSKRSRERRMGRDSGTGAWSRCVLFGVSTGAPPAARANISSDGCSRFRLGVIMEAGRVKVNARRSGSFRALGNPLHQFLHIPLFRQGLHGKHERLEITAAALLERGMEEWHVVRIQAVQGKVRVVQRKLPDLPVLGGVEDVPASSASFFRKASSIRALRSSFQARGIGRS